MEVGWAEAVEVEWVIGRTVVIVEIVVGRPAVEAAEVGRTAVGAAEVEVERAAVEAVEVVS